MAAQKLSTPAKIRRYEGRFMIGSPYQGVSSQSAGWICQTLS
jgi:hypothetical protein